MNMSSFHTNQVNKILTLLGHTYKQCLNLIQQRTIWLIYCWLQTYKETHGGGGCSLMSDAKQFSNHLKGRVNSSSSECFKLLCSINLFLVIQVLAFKYINHKQSNYHLNYWLLITIVITDNHIIFYFAPAWRKKLSL